MKRPALKSIAVSDVLVGDRLRQLDHAWIEALAASIKTQGLQQPIVVKKAADGQAFMLIAGAHRLAAAKRLDWPEIDAVVHEEKWLKAHEHQLLELTENLIRHELTALDRALHLKALKDIHLALNPAAKPGGDRKSEAFKAERENQSAEIALWFGASFSEVVAERINLSKRSIETAVAMAVNLTDEAIGRLRGTAHADHQAGLITLSKLNPDQQRAVCDLLLCEPPMFAALPDAIAGVVGRPQANARDRFVASFTNTYRRLRLQPHHKDALFCAIEADFVAWQRKREGGK